MAIKTRVILFLQSSSIKEIYISFRRKIALTMIQNYLTECGLINLINVDVIHKIPSDESYEKFQAMKLKYWTLVEFLKKMKDFCFPVYSYVLGTFLLFNYELIYIKLKSLILKITGYFYFKIL